MSKIIRAIKRVIQEPERIIIEMNRRGYFKFLSDKKCCELLWWAKTGKRLDLSNPKGFNEKLQWIKFFDRRPEYTQYADKYLVREHVAKTIGDKYLIPLLGEWKKPEDIDFDSLPHQFILKCNHNSGGALYVCRDKSKIDVAAINKEFRRALKTNYYYEGREWAYKDISPRIIAEEFIVDEDSHNTSGTLIDYKFYCFNGEPKFLYVGVDDISDGTKGELKLSFFDLDWNTPEFYRADHKPIPVDVKKPDKYDEMVAIARELSKGFPFVRVDLYWVNGKIYFSEMTFYPGAGFGFFSPEEWEYKIGDWITLPQK